MNSRRTVDIIDTDHRFDKEIAYWQEKLSGDLEKTYFPYDFLKGSEFRQERISFEVKDPLYSKIAKICQKSDYKLFVFLTAALSGLLNRYTGKRDIILAAPIYKQELDTEFINTILPLRIKINHEVSFKELVYQIKEVINEASVHQNCPLETVLNLIKGNGDIYSSILDIVIVINNVHEKKYTNSLKPAAIFAFTDTTTQIIGEVKYNSALYNKQTLKRIVAHLIRFLEASLMKKDEPIENIEIITKEERKQIVTVFNDTHSEYPRDKTIPDLFEEQVEKNREKIAVVFQDKTITYNELNCRSNQLANYLRMRGIKPDTPAAVLLDRSLEMIIGALAILKAGGAYLPMDPEYPHHRLQFMLKDSGAKTLLTSQKIKLPPFYEQNNIIIDGGEMQKGKRREEVSNPIHINSPIDLAYIIYTSGTTGRPKGVMIPHKNVIRLMVNDRNLFDFNPSDVWTMFHSFCFDFSVWEMYGALLYGGKLIVIPGMEARDPGRFLKILKQEKVTILNQTPSVFYILIDEDLTRKSKELKLRYVIFGGEALNPIKLKKWKEKYPTTKLVNMYGITETTVHVTYKAIGDTDIALNISNIGKPIPTLSTYIMDRNLNILPIGVPGELWVGGEGLARGYLNRPELTGEKFVQHPYQALVRLYRSGDLARFSVNGEMEYLGRIDRQVQLRGFRIELGEIESQLLKHEHIKEAVLVSREHNTGERYLCAYIVSGQLFSPSQLRDYLSKELPDYMIPGYFVRMEKIPLTPNGKIDRARLPDPAIELDDGYAPPRNEMEEKLVKTWAKVLGIEEKIIGIDAVFFDLGGHSLNATVVISKIHQELNVKVPLKEFFRRPTIRELSGYIEKQTQEKYASIENAEKKDYYVLSSAQRRLFVLQQLEPANVGYNIPQVNIIEGYPEVERVEAAFREMIDRHQVLRTAIETIDGEPVQRIYETVDFKVIYQETDEEKAKEIFNTFVKPFDLGTAPFLRVELIKIGTARHVLLFDMHHIISDGVSHQLFLNQLFSIYAGRLLSSLPIQYKDYAQWQNSKKQKEKIAQQQDYWVNEFAGEIPVLNLPTDYPRPSIQSFEGYSIDFTLKPGDAAALIRIAKAEKGTLFMVLLAIYNILLAKLTAEGDIVVGTPIAGRRHPDLENLIGMFVNTLVLRNYPIGTKTFKTFLREIKNRTLMSFENQDYLFEELLEQVAVTRDMSRNPLFDVMFTLQNIKIQMDQDLNIESNLKVLPYENNNTTSQFDLTLTAVEGARELVFLFQYCTKLFKKETIERFIGYFKKIVSSVVKDPGIKLVQIEAITGEEKRQLLYGINKTNSRYPKDKTIHRLFEEQTRRTPDRIAVVGPCVSLGAINESLLHRLHLQITYRELNNISSRMAHWLRQKGVEPDTIVAIMIERSPKMIIGILGILKAGGGYLPIDPGYPQERIDYMLNDSASEILVTTQDYSKEIKFEKDIIYISDPINHVITPPCLSLSPVIDTPVTSLAYIIYTSGTTGQPKGSLIQHRNVVRLLFNDKFPFDFNSSDTWTMFHSYCFDFSVWEMYGALLYGGKLVLIAEMTARDPQQYLEIVKKENVTILNQTPPVFYNLAYQDLKSPGKQLNLRYVIFGGEALNLAKLREWKEKYPETKLINMFGITETTVHVTAKEIKETDILLNISNIGKPIPTLYSYVMDKNLKLVPRGVPGELCVGGEGVGRGYLNRPELTSEKFVNHPYISGQRIYRSGDSVRILENGDMEYLGRIDLQVKIRGYRIELGEIENQLLTHKRIKEVVVLEKEHESGDKYLYAYIVPRDSKNGNPPEVTELKNHLSQKLPGYMIPSYFVLLEKLPLTANGKIDRNAIDSLGERLKTGIEYVAPKSNKEKIIAETWQEVLNLDKVGIYDNFFDVGGNSLNIIRLSYKLKQTLNMDIPIMTLFRFPSISSFLDYLHQNEPTREENRASRREKLKKVEDSLQDTLKIFGEM